LQSSMHKNQTYPKVSIIITTYNGSRYIAETIGSVQAQTFTNWEMVIIDDGSNDDTCEIIAGIKDERIQLHKAGRIGINGKVKNIGLAMARCELIAFIDHDDLWAPEKLEKQIAALEENPGAGFCLTGGYNFKIKGEPFEYFYKQSTGARSGNIFLPLFNSEIAPWTQALLMHRHCIKAVGAFSETSLFGDPDFIFRLAYHYKAVVLYEPLFYRRLHESNYSSVNWVKSHEDGIDLIRSYKNKKMLDAKSTRAILFRSHIHFGEKCISEKRLGRSLHSFYLAWKQKPLSIIPLKKTAKAFIQYLKNKVHLISFKFRDAGR